MRSIAEKELQRLFAIAGDVDVVGQFLFAQSMQSQLHVVVVVFNQ
jgi:hypothetical protein